VPESCHILGEQLKGLRVPGRTGAVSTHRGQLTGSYSRTFGLKLGLLQPVSCVYFTVFLHPGAIDVARQVTAHNLSLTKTAEDQGLSLPVASH